MKEQKILFGKCVMGVFFVEKSNIIITYEIHLVRGQRLNKSYYNLDEIFNSVESGVFLYGNDYFFLSFLSDSVQCFL